MSYHAICVVENPDMENPYCVTVITLIGLLILPRDKSSSCHWLTHRPRFCIHIF